MRPISISPSQISSMECRLQWFWGTKRGLRQIKINPALDLGSAVHVWMEAFYIPNAEREKLEVIPDPFKVMDDWFSSRKAELQLRHADDMAKWDEMRNLAQDLMRGYVAHYGDDPYREWDVLESEKTLYYPIPDPRTGEQSSYRISARLDGIVRDRTFNTIHSLEHKTYSSFDAGHFQYDHQFTSQILVGKPYDISSVIYNGVRKQRPGPRVRVPIYQREEIHRNAAQINAFLIRAFWLAEQFYGSLSEELPIYPEPSSRRCGMCDFREPCSLYMRGGSPKIVLSEKYRVERYRPKIDATKSAGVTSAPQEEDSAS